MFGQTISSPKLSIIENEIPARCQQDRVKDPVVKKTAHIFLSGE